MQNNYGHGLLTAVVKCEYNTVLPYTVSEEEKEIDKKMHYSSISFQLLWKIAFVRKRYPTRWNTAFCKSHSYIIENQTI